MGFGNRIRPHAAVNIGGNRHHRCGAKPHDACGACDRVMAVFRREDTQAAFCRHAVPPYPVFTGMLTRRQQRSEVGLRAARGQYAVDGSGLPADQCAQPAQHLAFEHGRGRAGFVDCHCLIGQRCDQIAQGRDRQRRRHLMTQIARVVDSEIARQDVDLQFFQQAVEIN